MQDRNNSRVSLTDGPDLSTGLIGSSSPVGGDDIENRSDDETSFVQDFVGVDHASEDPSISEDLLSIVADASHAMAPITGAVTRAAFLVTNWLVVEGEG